VVTLGSEGDDTAADLKLDAHGNPHLLLGGQGQLTDSRSGRLQGMDTVVVKYDPEGNILWSNNAHGSPFPVSSPTSLGLDASGNCYVTGYKHGALDFGFTLIPQESRNYDVYLAKYAADGRPLWAKQVGHGGTGYNPFIHVEPDGHLVLCEAFTPEDAGYYQVGTWRFYGGFDDTYHLVTRMDAEGNPLWAQAFGGYGSSDLFRGRVLEDSDGDILVFGRFSGQLAFPGFPSVGDPSYDAGRAFLAKYSHEGQLLLAKALDDDDPTGHYFIPNVYAANRDRDSILMFSFCTGSIHLGGQFYSAPAGGAQLFLA
jgi:hypothetical protein